VDFILSRFISRAPSEAVTFNGLIKRRDGKMSVRGNLDKIILNESHIYEGDLVKYFQVVFFNSKNLQNSYHNFRHVMQVTWLCYDACLYYMDLLNQRQMRNLLIAAMFHDFDHSGTIDEDTININLAIKAIRKYIRSEDREHLNEIIAIIKSTEYPYKTTHTSLELCNQIIRDADLAQSLCSTWLQQVIFGLSDEWGKTPLEVLKKQSDFHYNLNFYTMWAKEKWPKEVVSQKIEEVINFIQILESP
jgi:hypothetical protein